MVNGSTARRGTAKKILQDPHVAQEYIYGRNESPASRELTRLLMEHTLSSEDGEILTDS
jgi:hypothetical protein